jgi:hypothetical protein
MSNANFEEILCVKVHKTDPLQNRAVRAISTNREWTTICLIVDWHASPGRSSLPLGVWISSLGMTRSQLEVNSAYVRMYDYSMMTSANETVDLELQEEHGRGSSATASHRKDGTNDPPMHLSLLRIAILHLKSNVPLHVYADLGTTSPQRAHIREAIELRERLGHKDFKRAIDIFDVIDSSPALKTAQVDVVEALAKTTSPGQAARVIDALLQNRALRAISLDGDDERTRHLSTTGLHRATIARWIIEVGDDV